MVCNNIKFGTHGDKSNIVCDLTLLKIQWKQHDYTSMAYDKNITLCLMSIVKIILVIIL